jgi:nitronate monooxygenase
VLGIVLQQVVELREHDTANPHKPSAPFAVNQVVNGSNGRLREDLDMCMEFKLPSIITSLDAKKFVNEAIHSYGGVVLHDVINNHFAKKAIEKGPTA